MEEEIKEEIKELKAIVKKLENRLLYQQEEISRITKIINNVNMIRVCEILKEQY